MNMFLAYLLVEMLLKSMDLFRHICVVHLFCCEICMQRDLLQLSCCSQLLHLLHSIHGGHLYAAPMRIRFLHGKAWGIQVTFPSLLDGQCSFTCRIMHFMHSLLWPVLIFEGRSTLMSIQTGFFCCCQYYKREENAVLTLGVCYCFD